MKNVLLLIAVVLLYRPLVAQQSTPENNTGGLPDLVLTLDSAVFKSLLGKNGFTRLYQVADPDVSYISPISKTRIDLPGSMLICIEGTMVNGKRQGLFITYVIDNANHTKKYKIHEQDFKINMLDGHWKAYDISGTLKYDQAFIKDRQAGLSFYYGADGKTVIQTTRIVNDSTAVLTKFDDDGIKKQEQTMVKGIPNGLATVYYPSGSIMSTANFLNGRFNDTLKYYYPSGVLWTEEIFKNGRDWKVLNNFDSTGKPRDAGTLKNGNGTRILYTEEGQVREVATYVDGIMQ